MKVLIADDHKPSREKLSEIIDSIGHEPILAKNGREAYDIYTDSDVTIVFIDWSMPKMDGIELCRRIKGYDAKRKRHSYLLLATSKSKKRDMVEGLEAGADDFVLKPYDECVIKSRMNIALRVLETRITKEVLAAPNAVKIMQDEHELIHRMTGIMEMVSNMLSDDVPLPPKLLKWCTSTAFTLDFELHEKKEEFYIDRFIQRASEIQGQTSKIYSRSSIFTILREHDLIERLLTTMKKKMETYNEHRPQDTEEIRKLINRYIPLIRFHAAREDDIFFPFTETYLTDEDNEELAVAFKQVDADIGAKQIRERMDTLDRLEEILKIG